MIMCQWQGLFQGAALRDFRNLEKKNAAYNLRCRFKWVAKENRPKDKYFFKK